MSDSITAFAPASIGNLGVGFDMLGLALEGVGDRVQATRINGPGVTIAEVRGLNGKIHPYLATEAHRNTASIAAQALLDACGSDAGIELRIYKGVPLQSGMGSSAASAVAAAVATNALLDVPLEHAALLPYALEGEKFASGGLHADNVAPCLVGGLVLCPTVLLPDVIRLPVLDEISAVLVHPHLQVNTAHARRALDTHYSLQQWLRQQGYLAGFIAACAAGDIDLMRRTLRDVIVEPQRKSAVSCFDAVKEAALGGGAIGCSLSGSGPSIFALCENPHAPEIADAMAQACRDSGIECESWISSLDTEGARLEPRTCDT